MRKVTLLSLLVLVAFFAVQGFALAAEVAEKPAVKAEEAVPAAVVPAAAQPETVAAENAVPVVEEAAKEAVAEGVVAADDTKKEPVL